MGVYDEFTTSTAQTLRNDVERCAGQLGVRVRECPATDPRNGNSECSFASLLFEEKEKAAKALSDEGVRVERAESEDAVPAINELRHRIESLDQDDDARHRLRLTMQVARLERAQRMLRHTSRRIREILAEADELRHPDVPRLY